ncbi:MAG: bifunctional phosphoribosylaminoimidazolecarboxamide formyltransferase/IMP cyclohydrolase [Deltaproteobacteria bacterium]|nr:bifunctional phosphoribosylaminoimidazolecarboxamide formyltransferase/IMP cyclohydrolase [Deltaproteobacteria bacterium]
MPRRYALLSVSDKTGLVDFARGLVEQGFTLLSTGGTARALAESGLGYVKVADHTGAPEIMDGRVKTLHPRIHGGILARRGIDEAVAEAQGIAFIDVVAVNLYPFEATVLSGADEATVVENIDIGGPAMVRAAAKNHARVHVVVDPLDYPSVLDAVATDDLPLRRRLAAKAYRHTSTYDAIIARWFGSEEPFPAELAIPLRKVQGLRYGENPHQHAAFYASPLEAGRSLASARQLQGKELSFNNLGDLDAALRVAFDLPGPGCAIIKHANPCGAAVHEDGLVAAYRLALSADPVSAYGGILALNRRVTGEDAASILASKVFYEVIAAPGLDDEARRLLATRANLRVLELPGDWGRSTPPGHDARRVQGGYLLQDWDSEPAGEWRSVLREPTAEELAALRFAWAVCANVKSNAIVLARGEEGGLVVNGVGAGQMSRVDSVRLAVEKATRPVPGSVLASDAFFPFPDGVATAASAGVTAIVQPGGSIRDAEVIDAARAAGMAMLLTGARHFRH